MPTKHIHGGFRHTEGDCRVVQLFTSLLFYMAPGEGWEHLLG